MQVCEGGAGAAITAQLQPLQAAGHNNPMKGSRLENCPVEKDLEVQVEHEPECVQVGKKGKGTWLVPATE